MKLTKREAIRECKRIWKKIGKSGLDKYAFLDSPNGKKWLAKGYECDCPLCEYAKGTGCYACPLFTQYNITCTPLGYEEVGHDSTRFLASVKGLKE